MISPFSLVLLTIALVTDSVIPAACAAGLELLLSVARLAEADDGE